MRVMILIEEVATRLRLWYDEGEYYDSILFQWEDGNYSCDCNRALFFARAGRKPDIDIDCSDGKYKVICILREDGVQLGAAIDYRSILKAAGYFGYDPRNHAGRRL